MKRKLLKNPYFWLLLIGFILTLLAFFAFPYLFASFLRFINKIIFVLAVWIIIFLGIFIIQFAKKGIDFERLEEFKKKREERRKIQKEIKQAVQVIKDSYKKAIKILKKSSFMRKLGAYRYELPWYFVYGYTNAGKTSLLEKSGIKFPLNVDHSGRTVDVLSNTEVPTWYFSEEAVFIDVPGKYMKPENNDKIVWHKFLSYFQRSRWRRPLNAIILTVSMQELEDMEADDLLAFSKELRSNFDYLSGMLHQELPIYLVLTKCDEAIGFAEFFSNLSLEEKNQAFGVILNKGQKVDSQVVDEKFSLLVKRINQQLYDRLHKEADEDTLKRIVYFPLALANVVKNLKIFTDACFAESRYHRPLWLRGIFVTSSNETIYPGHGDGVVQKSGFFIRDLLQKVISSESDIAKIDKKFSRKLWAQNVILLGITVLLIFSGIYYLSSDFAGRLKLFNLLTNEQERILPEIAALDIVNIKSEVAVREFIRVLDAAENLKKLAFSDGPSEVYRPSFHYIQNRHDTYSDIYLQTLIEVLLPYITERLYLEIGKRDLEYEDLWDASAAYIMLNITEKRENDFLVDRLAFLWASDFQGMTDVQKQLIHHWQNLLGQGFPQVGIDSEGLERVRKRLKGESPARLIYRELRKGAEEYNLPSFAFSSVIGDTLYNFSGADFEIPGMFTYRGFQQIFVARDKSIVRELAKRNWVVGYSSELSEAELDSLYNSIQSMYFNEYKSYWLKALSTIKVRHLYALNDIDRMLIDFTSLDSPIYRIVSELKRNVELYTPAELLAKKLGKNKAEGANQVTVDALQDSLKAAQEKMNNRGTSNLRKTFAAIYNLLDEENLAGPQMERVVKVLESVYAELNLLKSSVDIYEDSLNKVLKRVSGEELPTSLPPGQVSPPVDLWIKGALANYWQFIISQAAIFIDNYYKENIYSYYSEYIKDHYPFAKGKDISIENFNDFFAQDSLFNKFYTQYVSIFVGSNKLTKKLQQRKIDTVPIGFNLAFISGVEQYLELLSTVYDRSGKVLDLKLMVQAHSLSKNLGRMQLKYGDQIVEYAHGPIRPKQLRWPLSRDAETLATFILYDVGGAEMYYQESAGDWSLFHLLDKLQTINWSNIDKKPAVMLQYSEANLRAKYLIYGKFVQNLKESRYPLRFELPASLLGDRIEDSNKIEDSDRIEDSDEE